jgi:hypothetical protein
VIPEQLQNFADLKLGEKKKKNAAFDLVGEFSKSDIDTSNVKSGGLHLGVHSPITESEPTIKEMKKMQVASVDCEAGFIADALADSKVSVYNIFYISDVPGTQESIGQGGIASTDTPEVEGGTSNKTEQMVVKIIETIVKQKIEQADVEAKKKGKYILGSDGRLTEKIKIDNKNKRMKVDVVIPDTVKGDVMGILKVFGQNLSDFLDQKKGNMTTLDTEKVNEMVVNIYRKYRILLVVSYEDA